MSHGELHLPGIRDQRVLAAMHRVPREKFVPEELRRRALGDHPLPIGYGQTISQPLIVAEMTSLIHPGPTDRVLDVGTGSGYQAAVLAELAAKVYSIEIIEPLAEEARQRLADLEYANVEVRCGDGSLGWPEQAPFDGIICAAAPTTIPTALVEQLAPGGRMAIPVGGASQQLWLITKDDDGRATSRPVVGVAFVPMTGAVQRKNAED